MARASRLYDEVYVAVMINQSKKGLFEVEERIELIREVTADYGNVRVEAFHGLLVDFCKQRDIPAIVKGLRAVSDFDYELQMAQMNNGLSGVETLFVPTNPTYSFLSSSLVKEVAAWGGDVSHLVPPQILAALTERLRKD
ncbi:pantetheine-phosphate adenylyltransferase [Streptomyces sp. NPDC086077]|uniref:pantetheine-phosphate adenylyltransferase n=1 Tax=Streptomyces sp. NPDC086077 TaxID=3154862 RepID=UPI00342690CD